ncbi:hypothetical protein PUN28_005833 [Cardiocondyla obscurior]|uniref:Uncharacterized protein n=1 Tax=Cardiocondyla obscurior TaxID=286306 RepID=A0AAW2G8N0_9HYME
MSHVGASETRSVLFDKGTVFLEPRVRGGLFARLAVSQRSKKKKKNKVEERRSGDYKHCKTIFVIIGCISAKGEACEVNGITYA